MSLNEDPTYRDLAIVLHEAWSRVKWSKMGTSKTRRASDIFQHRLKKAAYCSTVNEAIERLCKGLSLQSLNIPVSVIERLNVNSSHTMDILRRESVVLTVLAQKGSEIIDSLE